MRIWKYPIEITDVQKVEMPEGSQVLTVQFQGLGLVLWALVNPSVKEIEGRMIHVYGTGHPIPEDPGEYIATAQDTLRGLVWHIFEQDPI